MPPNDFGHPIMSSTALTSHRDVRVFSIWSKVPAHLVLRTRAIIADQEYVIVHGRSSGHGLTPRHRIAVDVVRIADVYSWSTGTFCKTKQPGKVAKRVAQFGASFPEKSNLKKVRNRHRWSLQYAFDWRV
jgi:hypothetical protein